MNKRNIIIISGIAFFVLVILALIISFFAFNAKSEEKIKRNNMIKLIEKYIDREEFDRALDKVEEILLENPDDEEILNLQDKILGAKKEKEADENLKDRLEREKLLESMNSMIDKSNDKQIIVRTNEDRNDSNLSSKEKEKRKKLDELIEKGLTQYNSQKYAQAKDIFLKALDIEDDNAEANAYLGMTLYDENPNDKKAVEEAIKKIKKALKKNNNIESAHFTLAKIYEEQGLSDSAIDEYKETLKLNPNNYEAFYSLGRIYFRTKDYTGAESSFESAVRIKPDYVSALYALATTKFNLGKTNEAKNYYKKTLAADPNYYRASFMLGEAYRTENNYAGALEYYKIAVKQNNKYSYHQKIGECYKNLKNPDNAVESFQTSISLNPKDNDQDIASALEAYENIAEIEKNRGRYDKAIENAEKGLNIKESSVLYYITAFSKSKSGKTEEAINDYLKALDLNPKDIESYINLSNIYNEEGRYEDSITILQKGISVDRNQFKLYNNLGDSFQKLKNFEQAIVSYKKSIDINPSAATTYYNLGICYEEVDKKNEAAKSFQQAIAINKNYYDAYYQLAEIYFSQEKFSDAKSILKIILAENPSYPKRDNIDKMLSIIGN